MTINKYHISLLATGGTIAGQASNSAATSSYTAGVLSAETLLAALPEMPHIQLSVANILNIDSKDVVLSDWNTLVEKVQLEIAKPDVDAVVITHGTDTLEESAQLLHLTTRSAKPIILTAAMRPASALSADGPINLYDALQVAAHPDSVNRGVMVCMNRQIWAAEHLRKTHTLTIDSFSSNNLSCLGRADPVHYYYPAPQTKQPIFTLPKQGQWPRVDILYVSGGMDTVLLEAAIHAKAQGIVLILPGNGSLPKHWESLIRKANAQHIRVLRCSRCPFGEVSIQESDAELGCTSAQTLSPAAARIRLMLAIYQDQIQH